MTNCLLTNIQCVPKCRYEFFHDFILIKHFYFSLYLSFNRLAFLSNNRYSIKGDILCHLASFLDLSKEKIKIMLSPSFWPLPTWSCAFYPANNRLILLTIYLILSQNIDTEITNKGTTEILKGRYQRKAKIRIQPVTYMICSWFYWESAYSGTGDWHCAFHQHTCLAKATLPSGPPLLNVSGLEKVVTSINSQCLAGGLGYFFFFFFFRNVLAKFFWKLIWLWHFLCM